MIRAEHIAEGISLHLGDCREILPTLGTVDAVVTDPPFNVGKDFQNDNMSEAEWRRFCDEFALILYGIKATNFLIEVGKGDTAMRTALDRVLPYRWALALNYTNAMRNGSCGYANFGLVYWYGGKCYKRYMDRIDAALESTVDQFSHPSPKEIKHYAKLVEMFSPDKGHILDPFIGLGHHWHRRRKTRPQVHGHRNRAEILRHRLQENFSGVEADRPIHREARPAQAGGALRVVETSIQSQ